MDERVRVVARFVPQKWVRDHALDLDEDGYGFDVTALVHDMPVGQLILINDDYEADALWHRHPVSAQQPWDGPFKIVVKDAIDDYLSVRMETALLETPDAESVVMSLLDGWHGTFDELITTARLLDAAARAASLPEIPTRRRYECVTGYPGTLNERDA